MELNDILHSFTWDPGSVLRRSVPARYLSLSVGHDAMGQLVASRRPAVVGPFYMTAYIKLLGSLVPGIRLHGST